MVIELLKALLLFTSLAGYCLYITYKFKWKFETTPFFVITSIGCVLYAASILNVLFYLPGILLAGGIISFLFVCYEMMYKQRAFEGGTPVFAFLMFSFLFFGLFVLSRNQQVFIWDEFAHWALAVKELLHQNYLPAFNSSLIVPNYPPISTLLQYFTCRIMGSSEPNYYFGQSLFFLTLAMLFTSFRRNRQRYSAIASVMFLIVFVKVMGYVGDPVCLSIFSLYADAPLAFVFSGIVLELLSSKDSAKVTYLRVLPALFCLSLIKQIGILLSLACILLIIIRIFLEDNKENHATRKINKYIPALLAMGVVGMAFISWEVHTKFEKLSQESILSNQPISLSVLQDGAYRNKYVTIFDKIDRFIRPGKDDRVFFNNLIKKINIVQNPPGVSLVTVLLVNFLIFLLFRSFYSDQKKWITYFAFFPALLFAAIVYLAFLMYVYMFIMIYIDGSNISSLYRYMFPFVFCIGTINFYFARELLEDVNLPPRGIRDGGLVLGSITISVLLLNTWFLCEESDIGNRVITPNKSHAIFLAEKFDSFIPEDSRVFHIDQGDNGILHFVLKYEMYPRRFQFWGWNIFTRENIYQDKKGKIMIPDGAVQVSPRKLSEAVRIGNFDYVWVTYGNTQFWKDYGSLFDKPGNPDGYYLFRVEKEKFVLVNTEK